MKLKISTNLKEKYGLLPKNSFEHGIHFSYKFYEANINNAYKIIKYEKNR